MLRESKIAMIQARALPSAGKTEDPPLLHLDAPAIVFGGPYGNLEATRALLEAAERLGIAGERMICTGDVVAYCADAAATVDLVRRSGARVVMGNCEESLAAGSGDCGCGFVPGSACEQLAAAWFAHADRMLDADARAWMASLPRRIDLAVDSRRLAVVHGGAGAINRFLFASTAPAIKAAELETSGADGIIGGHCGLPFSQIIRGKLWHNAGAIGLPANDGTPRTWFSLLVPQANGLRIEHRALGYDHATAARKVRAAGLPEEYAVALVTGLWPSCDVLPYREIRARGVPLEAGHALWRAPAWAPQPARRRRPVAVEQAWPDPARDNVAPLRPPKFKDPRRTAGGEPRASVALRRLETLWFNTGTLCNIACRNCYIESSPRNGRLAYLTRAEVLHYLDEIERGDWGTQQIGFTGGEPFLNPDLIGMIEDCVRRGFRVIVLTNAMRPMQRRKTELLALHGGGVGKLHLRVSLDHFTQARHEDERGPGTFRPTLEGLQWLARNGFDVSVAGRGMWGEDEAAERAGFAKLFAEHGIPLDARDPADLVLFPEMDSDADVPEIGAADWERIGKAPGELMCAASRMVIKRKGSAHPAVVACTLIPYDPQFELGRSLREAARDVPLNHPHCAQFCVFGGGSCSAVGSGAQAAANATSPWRGGLAREARR
jgi:sulfatase maturation enzyme AslB (radical SAM superfamily)/predicted phosphodiesterase